MQFLRTFISKLGAEKLNIAFVIPNIAPNGIFSVLIIDLVSNRMTQAVRKKCSEK